MGRANQLLVPNSRSGLSSPPTINSSATFNVVENTTAVGTVTATGGQTPYTFSISGGADSALFSINSSTGALAFLVAPDYLDPGDDDLDNVYEVEVTAASVGGAESDPQAIAVTVTFNILAHGPILSYTADQAYTDEAGTTPATSDGNSVLYLDDASASNLGLTRSAGGKEWTLAIVNGIRTLSANDKMLTRAAGLTMTADRIIFIVEKFANTSHVGTPLQLASPGATGSITRVLGVNGQMYLGGHNSDATNVFTYDTTWHLAVFRHRATTPQYRLNNGSLTTLSNLTVASFSDQPIYLGNTQDNGAPYVGSVRSVHVFDGNLTTDEINGIADWLHTNEVVPLNA